MIMNFRFSDRSNRRRKGVNPLLIECSDRALAKSKYDMTIPWMGGVRTAIEQNDIFKEGNSKADGYTHLSYHQIEKTPEDPFGNALDTEPVGYNKDGVSEKHLARARNHFAQLMFSEWQLMIKEGKCGNYVLEWGGLWGSAGWDKQHWQLVTK